MEISERVRNLVCNKLEGGHPWFVMIKSLKSSDLDSGQKRLLIPSKYVDVNLIPMLFKTEKADANLLHHKANRNMPATSRVEGIEVVRGIEGMHVPSKRVPLPLEAHSLGLHWIHRDQWYGLRVFIGLKFPPREG